VCTIGSRRLREIIEAICAGFAATICSHLLAIWIICHNVPLFSALSYYG
jgi:hypothetical protein